MDVGQGFHQLLLVRCVDRPTVTTECAYYFCSARLHLEITSLEESSAQGLSDPTLLWVNRA